MTGRTIPVRGTTIILRAAMLAVAAAAGGTFWGCGSGAGVGFCDASNSEPGDGSGNLLRNGSFEAAVMPPEWIFVADDGVDAAGLRYISSTSHIHREQENAADGTYALFFRGIGPATLASRRLAYDGGTLILEGFVTAEELESIVTGSGGVIELAGFAASGEWVESRPAVSASGSFPWRRFRFQGRFAPGVTEVELRLRSMPAARGVFGVDGLVLRIEQDE